MKNIISFKVKAAAFHVRQMIRFYKYCEQLGQNVYIYGKNQVKQVHRMSDWLAELIDRLSAEKECLVVVEGDHAHRLQAALA